MKDIRCDVAVAALVSTLEKGTPLDEEVRTHLLECERCSALVDGARNLEKSLETSTASDLGTDDSAPVADAAAGEARRLRRERVVGRTLVAILASIIFGFLAAIPFLDTSMSGGESTGVVIAAFAIAVLLAAPILVLMTLIRRQRNGKPSMYKRLGPGRMLSGVCLGLSERTGWPVLIFRLLFVALTFGKMSGVLLYILFDLFMPVHPADRQYLLRFRIARWWRERVAPRRV